MICTEELRIYETKIVNPASHVIDVGVSGTKSATSTALPSSWQIGKEKDWRKETIAQIKPKGLEMWITRFIEGVD